MVSFRWLLFKKTLRDLSRLVGPSLILSSVLAIGLSSLILSQSNLESLVRSQQLTYENLQFADVVIPLVRFPRTAMEHVRSMNGITHADCRLTESGQVNLPDEQRQIVARFHSIPQSGALNQIKIISGAEPRLDSHKEAMLSDAFANAWHIRPGEEVEILLKGKRLKLKVSALVRSPEYIYQAGPATSIPDDKLFSVWWVHSRVLEQTNQLQSACNEILLKTKSKNEFTESSSVLSHYLRRYGFTQFIQRRQLLSHYFLEGELEQLRAMSFYLPAVFFVVTLFLLHITITRVLLSQREIIGTLRAFGVEKIKLIVHSLSLSFGCMLPGFILGTALGLWAGEQLFTIYIKYYRFAYTEFQPAYPSIGLGVGLAIAVTILGCSNALIYIFRQSPAVALTPEAPAHARKSWFDSLKFLLKLNILTRLSLRNIFRRPLHSAITLIGLILALSLFLFARFEETAIEEMMKTEFNQIQRQSHTLRFAQRHSRSSLRSVQMKLPDGLTEESSLIPAQIKFGLFERELLLAVTSDDENLRGVQPSSGKGILAAGLVLPRSFAEKAGITVTQRVWVTLNEPLQKTFPIEVTGLSENLIGSFATLHRKQFEKLSREETTFNTVLFKNKRGSGFPTDPLISNFPSLKSVTDKELEKKGFEQTIAESMNLFRGVMIGISLLIAMGVIYNNARIQFAEREREFALMRALGFSTFEIAILFWTDYFLLALISIIPGLTLGTALVTLLVNAVDTEIFTIPIVITPTSYLWAVAMLLSSLSITALLLQQRIYKLAYLSVLGSRE